MMPLLTGDLIDARLVLRIGLTNEALDPFGPDEPGREACRAIVEKASGAVQITKELALGLLDAPLEQTCVHTRITCPGLRAPSGS